jgi:Cupin superfamily protein
MRARTRSRPRSPTFLPISPKGSPSSLREAHQRGYTLVLRDIFRAWLLVAQLTREFQAVFFARLEVHLFVTPAGAQRLAPHYDSDNSFVLQISGAKDWKIFHTEVALPIGPQGHLVDADTLGEPSRRLTMRPGDLLYVPRGLVHAAGTTDAPSMHLTFGVFPYRWHDLLCDLICGLAEQEISLRRSVPLSALREGAIGLAPTEPAAVSELSSLLRHCLTKATLADPIQTHIRQLIDEWEPLETSLFDAISTEFSNEQLCAGRRGMICCIHDSDGRVALKFPGGGVSGPDSIRPTFEFIARNRDPFRLGGPARRSHASLQKRINPQVALRRASVSARSILHREPTARHRGLKEFPLKDVRVARQFCLGLLPAGTFPLIMREMPVQQELVA